jgi:hypothetical protein
VPTPIEARVPQNPVQSSALQFAVQRDDQEDATIWVAHANVTATLTQSLPAKPFEHTDQLHAGDDRLTLAHAGAASLRRTMPEPTSRPSSRRPSM